MARQRLTEQLATVRKELVKAFMPKDSGNFKECVTLLTEALKELETARDISPELTAPEGDSRDLETRLKSALKQLGNATERSKMF